MNSIQYYSFMDKGKTFNPSKRLNVLCLCLIFFVHHFMFGQSPVPVGGGSYAEYPPLNEAAKPFLSGSSSWGDQSQKMTHRKLYVIDSNTRAIPTNDWWTDLIYSKYSGDLWAHPIVVNAEEYGIYVKFPKAWNANGTALESKSQMEIRGVDFKPASAVARRWGDWTFDFLMKETDTKNMAVTLGHGLPMTWCEFTGVTPVITGGTGSYYTDAGTALSFPYTGDHFGMDINGDQYGIFAPAGTSFTLNGSAITVNFSGTQKFLVVAVMPNKSDLNTFYTYAYSIPRDSKVTWNYNSTAGQVNTTWSLTTQNLKGGTETNVIHGWIPHHYKNSTLGFSFNGMEYATPRGLMKCAVGKSFNISYKFNGILPNIPAPKTLSGSPNAYDATRMKSMIDNYSGKGGYGADTYWGGKDVMYMGQYMMMANETGNTAAFDQLKVNLRKALEDWYTYTPGEPEHYFAWYPNNKSLVGMNSSYGSDEFNDHHFHYGYYTYATAMLGLYDQDFLNKYKDMAKMVAKDYANWDRTDSRLPIFRNFDPWEGHSWAGGVGDPINGNGQESSSEAMQGWGGLYMLGVATGDNAMRDAGIFGYSIESRATAEYWFDRDRQNIDYSKYTKPYNSNITSQGIGWWTWFSGDPVWMHSIQWLPISPIMKYLYENTAFAKWDYYQMWNTKQMGGWDTDMGNDSGIGNVVLSYLQISNPDTAAAIFDNLWTNNRPTVKDNYTGGITYYYTHSHRYYGEIQWDKYTNIPTSTVYYSAKTGKTTYVVYNPLATEQTCKVYNSSGTQIASFKVPGKKLVAHQMDVALTTITVTSPVITVTPGSTLQMTATGYDQYGVVTPATIIWTVSGGGTINSSGLFTAGTTNGTYTITASSGGKSGTKVIRVGAAPVLTTIQLSPTNSTLEKGTSLQYSANVLDQYGDPFTSTVVWSVTGGGSINSSGLFTSSSVGSYTVTASSGAKTASGSIKVTFPLANIALGKPTTSSSNEDATLVPSNATDGLTGTRWASAFIDPSWIKVDLQATFDIKKVILKWESSYSKTYKIQISNDDATWSDVYTQPNGSGGDETIDLAATGRYIRMYSTARINTYGNSLWEFEVYGSLATGSTPTLSTIVVTPGNTQIKDNGSVQLSAQGYDQNGNTISINPTWQVLGTGSITSEGLYTPQDTTAGAVIVVAKSGTISGTTKVLVEPTLKASGVEITPATSASSRIQVATGIPQKFSATVFDQFKIPYPSSVVWSVSGGGTITQDGFFNPNATGDFMIFAKQGTKSDTAFVTVKSLTSINVASFKPVVVSSSENDGTGGDKAVDNSTATRWSSKWTSTEYIQVDLLNTYTLNNMVLRWEASYATKYNVQTSTDGTTWTPRFSQNAGAGGVETINLSGINARYVKVNCTERFLTAYGYSLYELEVYATSVSTTPYLASIKVTPDVATVSQGSNQQFTATPQDQFGNTFSGSIAWSTSGGGTISGTGLFSGQRAGAYDIQATSGGITSLATIYVNPTSSSSNIAPTANAGTDKSITLPTSSIVLNGAGNDADGTIAAYVWTRQSGPNSPVMSGNNTTSLTASNLVAGTYVFRLTVTDNLGATGFDEVNVVVNNGGSTNIALNKPVTVSSTENAGTPGTSAVDGNSGTRWASSFADPQYIVIDLQNIYNVNQVVLKWETASGKAFDIKMSNDNVNWGAAIYSTTSGPGGIQSLNVSGTGRYIRLYGTQRNTPYGYSLWEFEVYGSLSSGGNIAPTVNAGVDKAITLPTNSVVLNGSATDSDGTITSYLWTTISGPSNPTLSGANTANLSAGGLIQGTYVFRLTATDDLGASDTDDVNVVVNPASNVNLALNKSTTVSSTENAGTPGTAAVDGNGGTRWSSEASDPQWIYVDLGATYSVNRVKITWETALGKDYQVQISSNASTWTTLKSVTGNTSLVNDHTGLSGTGRYIRINGTLRGTQWGYSIWELEVYGTAVEARFGEESVATENLVIYPNPVDGSVLNLRSNLSKTGSVSIINGYGIEVKRMSSVPSEIDVSDLPAGVYNMVFIIGDKKISKRFIKK